MASSGWKIREGKRPAMEARDLFFSYGKNQILKGVNIQIKEGKITTILGANGSGKSTLFSLLTKNLNAGKGAVISGRY